MKRIYLIICLILSVVILFGCEKNEIIDNAKGRGSTMIISLTENKTTGYSWEYSILEGDDYGFVELVKDNVILPDDLSLVGAPITHEYYFIGKKPGKQEITFTYRRPWEGGETAYDVVYVLNVEENLNIAFYEKKKGDIESNKSITDFNDPRFE